MPEYLYESPTGEIKSVIQRMTEPHTFFVEGVEWKRVFLSPQAAIDTKWDANSSHDFINKTSKKKGTMGNLFDKSRELSEKREKEFGVDKTKEKYYENYSKTRGGKRDHPDVKKRKLRETLKSDKNFTVDI